MLQCKIYTCSIRVIKVNCNKVIALIIYDLFKINI